MPVDLDFITTFTFFRGIAPEDLNIIKDLFFEKNYDKGDIILFEEDSSEYIYLVSSGVIKVFKTSSDGKEQILYFIRPGEFLNDISIMDGGTNLGSASAVSPTVLYGLSNDEFQPVLARNPQILLNISNLLTNRIRQLVALVEDLSFKNVISRVARILLEHTEDSTDRKNRLTQQEMAAIAGTAREMIGRSLKTLDDEGFIRLDRHRIIIVDKEKLRELAAS